MSVLNSNDQAININNLNHTFSKEVIKRSGVNLNGCLHCMTCSGGCQFSKAMDFFPNQMIRLVQLGFKKDALSCSGIWICVGCNTCSIQCPMGIDISAITDVICQIAIEEKSAVGEPDVLKFHEKVLDSIKRYGRTHKLEIMLLYKLYKKNWFADAGVGLKMLAKRKLDILPARVAEQEEIREFFKKG